MLPYDRLGCTFTPPKFCIPSELFFLQNLKNNIVVPFTAQILHTLIVPQKCEKILPFTANSMYGKCSIISNALLFYFSNKIVVIRAGINKILVRIANREDPDQTASSGAVWSGSALFV